MGEAEEDKSFGAGELCWDISEGVGGIPKGENHVRGVTRTESRRRERINDKYVKENPKLFWKYIQSKTRSASCIPDLHQDEEKNSQDQRGWKEGRNFVGFLQKCSPMNLWGKYQKLRLKVYKYQYCQTLYMEHRYGREQDQGLKKNQISRPRWFPT